MKKTALSLIFAGSALVGTYAQNTNEYRVPITHFNDKEYPDDPNIGHRSAEWGKHPHNELVIKPNKSNYDILICPTASQSDSILLKNIDLRYFMPATPDIIGTDKNHELAALVGQEWNRREIKFGSKYFTDRGKSKEEMLLKYVHIANNSLQAGLWEVVLYTDEGGEAKPYFHGWFTFPKDLYEQLFADINKTDYKHFHKNLDHWHPIHNKIDPSLWRSQQSEHAYAFENKNQGFYTLAGEHAKKHKNILFPLKASHLQQYLTDSSSFAGLSAPGIYTKTSPRHTNLSKLEFLDKIYIRDVLVNNQKLLEFELVFHRKSDGAITRVFMGGFPKKNIPLLDDSQAHKGYQMPMGIGVHPFCEDYESAIKTKIKGELFYSMVLDKDNHWVAPQELGIGGLVFYSDARKNLHIWVLSFESHNFIGHFMVENF